MSRIFQVVLFLIIGSLSALLTIVSLPYVAAQRCFTRNKRYKANNEKIRSLALRMRVPQETLDCFSDGMILSNCTIKRKVNEFVGLGYPWIESMAVSISNLYEAGNLTSKPGSDYDELLLQCEKRNVPAKEFSEIFIRQKSKAKFKALEKDSINSNNTTGYSWVDRLSSAVEEIYNENNALYLKCNNLGVPKEAFYEIYLNEKEKINQRINSLISNGEIEVFISDDKKYVKTITDIYYENICELL